MMTPQTGPFNPSSRLETSETNVSFPALADMVPGISVTLTCSHQPEDFIFHA